MGEGMGMQFLQQTMYWIRKHVAWDMHVTSIDIAA